MAGVNMAVLVGNLGADPEIKSFPDGRKYATFSLATGETWKDKTTGERKERTEWHRVMIFNEGLVKVAGDYLKKGSKVYLRGKIQTRKWTGQDNIERYTTEIVLTAFDSVLQMLDRAERTPGPSSADTAPATTAQPAGPVDMNDEIPF